MGAWPERGRGGARRFRLSSRANGANANAGAGASLLAAALCWGSYRFLHTQLFPAWAALSFALNAVTDDKQFKVKCLDIGQTFSLKQ